MEEAYEELYQQFIRLRDICLQQAALLQRLTSAQGRPSVHGTGEAPHRGPLSPDPCCGSSDDGAPSWPDEEVQPRGQQAGVPDPTQLATVPHGPDGMGDNLMKRVTAPSGGAGWSPQADEWAGPSQFYNATGALCSTEANTEDQQTRAERISKMPWMMSSFLDSDLLSRGGLLLSEVTLNSQVCEFCQAVFPSDTTTRGEFLRHLTAHVT
uniref:Uncharacterized LOC102691194 n=1 Tax=Lepisosteus oculatus TaxID=7918 RepID=W5MA96_LEPOC